MLLACEIARFCTNETLTLHTSVSYATFHLYFNLPPFLLLLFLCRKRIKLAHLICISLVALIALIAASPWDNWAVHKGFWSFDWSRTTPISISAFGIDFKLPLEEYAFFIIESVLVGLLCVLFLPKPKEQK